MMRIAFGVCYSGTPYKGWQKQEGQSTVQGHLETAITQVADHPIEISCAGRTDAGVHATDQVIHFDTRAARSIRDWIHGVNRYLPNDIAITWAKVINENFHARHSATARRYWYLIHNRKTPQAILSQQITWHYHLLNTSLMQEAAQSLLGEHDFSAFRDAECQAKSPMRCVYYIAIKRYHDVVLIDICANGFLHHMVRNIVGVLLPIGAGKQPISWCETVLSNRDRNHSGITVSPEGLYLVGVDYPKEFQLPKQDAIGPWFFQSV